MRLTAFVFLIVMSMALVTADARAQPAETVGIIAVDADITGNGPTTLGPLNACTRAEPGGAVTVDLVVDAVPASRPLLGYQIDIAFDPDLLTLIAMDSEFLLGANGVYEPFEGLSDTLPATDGLFTIIVADLSALEDAESGKGVLSRLTFTAQGSGLSEVGPVYNPPDSYPALIDVQNTTIGVDSIGTASVAVGQDCPGPIEATPVVTGLPPIAEVPGLETPQPLPSPTGGGQASPATGDAASGTSTGGPDGASPTSRPTGGDGNNLTGLDESDGGTSTGTVVAVAALALAGLGLAGGGAFLLLKRRGGGGAGDAAP